jgi:hypothetical protein
LQEIILLYNHLLFFINTKYFYFCYCKGSRVSFNVANLISFSFIFFRIPSRPSEFFEMNFSIRETSSYNFLIFSKTSYLLIFSVSTTVSWVSRSSESLFYSIWILFFSSCRILHLNSYILYCYWKSNLAFSAAWSAA